MIYIWPEQAKLYQAPPQTQFIIIIQYFWSFCRRYNSGKLNEKPSGRPHLIWGNEHCRAEFLYLCVCLIYLFILIEVRPRQTSHHPRVVVQYWPWSRPRVMMDTCLVLASDWSRQITWPQSWPLIGRSPVNDGHVRITSNANTMDTDPHQGLAHGIMISGT